MLKTNFINYNNLIFIKHNKYINYELVIKIYMVFNVLENKINTNYIKFSYNWCICV